MILKLIDFVFLLQWSLSKQPHQSHVKYKAMELHSIFFYVIHCLLDVVNLYQSNQCGCPLFYALIPGFLAYITFLVFNKHRLQVFICYEWFPVFCFRNIMHQTCLPNLSGVARHISAFLLDSYSHRVCLC